MRETVSKIEIENLKMVIDNKGGCLGILCRQCLLYDRCKELCQLNNSVQDGVYKEAKKMLIDLLTNEEFYEL